MRGTGLPLDITTIAAIGHTTIDSGTPGMAEALLCEAMYVIVELAAYILSNVVLLDAASLTVAFAIIFALVFSVCKRTGPFQEWETRPLSFSFPIKVTARLWEQRSFSSS